MSTRCQVQVVAGGDAAGHEAFKVTLYHHTDGYPSYMLPLIFDAITGQHVRWAKEDEKFGAVFGERSSFSRLNMWQFGRPGKAASFLCAADPGVFEPEAGHELHGDIEWYYRVHCDNGATGSRIGGEAPVWRVEVFECRWDERDGRSEEKPGTLLGEVSMSCTWAEETGEIRRREMKQAGEAFMHSEDDDASE